MPVNDAALGQDGDGDGRRGGHDLSGQLNVDVNHTLKKKLALQTIHFIRLAKVRQYHMTDLR